MLKGDEDILIRDRESRDRMVASDTLTEDERQELADLRANRDKAEKAKAAQEEKDNAPLPDTHWLNLADGTTVTSKGVASHIGGIPVVRATEIPAELIEGGNPNAQPEHRF